MRLRNIPGARQAIEESKAVIDDPIAQKGRWQEVFGNDHPIHIEVGMGKGRFLMEMAALHPEINYIGIEMYSSVLLRALQKREEREAQGMRMPNCVFLCQDARLLPDIFAQGEVDRIYLNFSDPWPKARHDKRRLTSRAFLERYQRILSDGASIEFKTDNQDLFTFSLEEAEVAGWPIVVNTRDLHHDPVLSVGNVMTEYEEKFSSQGNPICKMMLRLPER